MSYRVKQVRKRKANVVMEFRKKIQMNLFVGQK